MKWIQQWISRLRTEIDYRRRRRLLKKQKPFIYF